MVKLTAVWLGDLVFQAENERRGRILLKSVREDPEFSPMESLLASLAGCAGISVVALLERFGQRLAGLRVEVEGERREEHPRIYTKIRLRYFLEGELDEELVEKAIRLSAERYCPVAAMISKATSIEREWKITKPSP